MTRPTCNLYLDGLQESARAIYRRARGWSQTRVYINENGDLSCLWGSQNVRAGFQLAAVYDSAITMEDIRDDLLEWQRSITLSEAAA